MIEREQKMLRRIGSVLCCAIFLGSSANAQVSFNTGYDVLPYCHNADATGGVPSGDTQQVVGEGFCMGVIAGIRYVVTSSIMDPKYRLCIPDNVSTRQALSVVVNYMHNHPEQLNHIFSTVALSALVDTWRCK
jgi:hypothetical protein